MIRSIIRAIALFSLAFALITAVLDLTRTIADSAWTYTSMGVSWSKFSMGTLEKSQTFVADYLHPFVWDSIIVYILQAPTWLVFALIWLLLTLATRSSYKKSLGSAHD